MIEHDTKLLKSEVIDRYNALLEYAATWLASEGVHVTFEPMFNDSKRMSAFIGHEKRKTFSREEVENIAKLLDGHVDERITDPEGQWERWAHHDRELARKYRWQRDKAAHVIASFEPIVMLQAARGWPVDNEATPEEDAEAIAHLEKMWEERDREEVVPAPRT